MESPRNDEIRRIPVFDFVDRRFQRPEVRRVVRAQGKREVDVRSQSGARASLAFCTGEVWAESQRNVFDSTGIRTRVVGRSMERDVENAFIRVEGLRRPCEVR